MLLLLHNCMTDFRSLCLRPRAESEAVESSSAVQEAEEAAVAEAEPAVAEAEPAVEEPEALILPVKEQSEAERLLTQQQVLMTFLTWLWCQSFHVHKM